jgi:hypothetical protein
MESPSPLRWLVGHDPVAIVPLVDPVIDTVGYDPRSAYAETFWLPVLGPASLVLLRRIADCLDDSPAGFPLPLAPTAASLGLGHTDALNAPLVRTLGRLVRFGMAAIEDEHLAVRRRLPPLAGRHIARLPGYLAERLRSDGASEPGPASHSGVLTRAIAGADGSGKPAGRLPGSGGRPLGPPVAAAAPSRKSA